ncbi:MAG TPA: hypothetical protein VMU83_09665 [Hanamia sp.]|nr:hypothetical protein [Hanamia sp.]
MSTVAIRNKINKSLEKMGINQLKSAYQIFKEFASQKENDNIQVDKKNLKIKIAKGISQLDNKEGTDFRTFLKELNKGYCSGE